MVASEEVVIWVTVICCPNLEVLVKLQEADTTPKERR